MNRNIVEEQGMAKLVEEEEKRKKEELQKSLQEEAIKKAAQKAQQTVVKNTVEDVKENQEVVNNIIKKDPKMTVSQKENAAIAASSEKELTESAARNVTPGQQEERSSLKNQFLDALTYFGPQIIAGVYGQATEGDLGLVAGVETAGKLRDSYLDYNFKRQDREDELKRAEIQAQRQRAFQQTDKFMTKDGQPLRFNPNKGTYETVTGEAVDPDNIVNTVDVRQQRSLEEREKDRILSQEKFGFQKQKESQLSDKQQNQLQDIIGVEKSLGRIEEIRNQYNKTGPFKGRVNSLLQLADAAPKEFTQLKVQTASTLSNYVKSISGAQVTEQEAARLQAIIPSVNDSPKVFEQKLNEFKKIVKINKQAFEDSIRLGQPMKAGTLRGLSEAESKFSTKKPLSSGSNIDIKSQLDIIRQIKAQRKK